MSLSRRSLLKASAASALLGGTNYSASGTSAARFSPLRIGGGGYNTSIYISLDGITRVIRTDTFSGYRWNSSTQEWEVFALMGRMPARDIGIDKAAGCWEVRVAPSNSSIVYQYTYYIHKSADGGVTWTRTNFSPIWSDPNAQPYRMVGPKMGIHPTNPNVVYVGTESNGVWYTMDGGMTWAQERSIPISGTNQNGKRGSHTVNFSPDGSAIYISSYGHGLYKGAVGASFASISGGPGAGAGFQMVKVASDGMLYMTTDPWVTNQSRLWRLMDGASPTWADITPSARWLQVVVCDPNNANRVLVGNGGGNFSFTLNATATKPTWSRPVPLKRVATDIPWLATTNEYFMSEGDAIFDRVVTNRLWLAEGIGTWYADLGTGIPPSLDYHSQTKGIEQLVATSIRATPKGDLIASSWDRAIFHLNASTPDTSPTSQTYDLSTSINHCWFIDWASSSPSFLIALVDADGGHKGPSYSSDGGATWTEFPIPAEAINLTGGYGGTLAAATPTNWLWQPQWDNDLWYTKNAGTSWMKIAITGVPANNGRPGVQGTNETGWGHNSALGSIRHHAICADRATPGIFYAMNTGGQNNSSYAGIYRSSDGGATWTKVFAGNLNVYTRDFWSCRIECVPKLSHVDTTGHLFYTCGQVGGPTNPDTSAFFKYSKNGGSSWISVANVLEVYAFGLGAAGTGKDYPTVFIAGWVRGVYGIWKAEANATDWAANSVTWTNLATYPYGWTDEVRTMDADKLIKGRVYMGFAGSGFAYGNT